MSVLILSFKIMDVSYIVLNERTPPETRRLVSEILKGKLGESRFPSCLQQDAACVQPGSWSWFGMCFPGSCFWRFSTRQVYGLSCLWWRLTPEARCGTKFHYSLEPSLSCGLTSAGSKLGVSRPRLGTWELGNGGWKRSSITRERARSTWLTEQTSIYMGRDGHQVNVQKQWRKAPLEALIRPRQKFLTCSLPNTLGHRKLKATMEREAWSWLGRKEVIYEDKPCFNWVLLNQNQTSPLRGDSQEAA